MECKLAGETEVLGENLPQRHFCPSQNPTLPDPGFLSPGRRCGKPATNRLSYGMAILSSKCNQGFGDFPSTLRSSNFIGIRGRVVQLG
jgi:hypothetical protein